MTLIIQRRNKLDSLRGIFLKDKKPDNIKIEDLTAIKVSDTIQSQVIKRDFAAAKNKILWWLKKDIGEKDG